MLPVLTREQASKLRQIIATENKRGQRERALEEAKQGIVPPALAAAIRKRHRKAERARFIAERGGFG